MSTKSDDEGCLAILGIVGIGVAIYFIVSFWYIILPIVIIIAIIAIWGYVMNKKENAKKVEMEIARRAEEQRLLVLDIHQIGFWNFVYRGTPTNSKHDTETILNEIIKYPIIVDTSVWMDSFLQDFWITLFDWCKRFRVKVIIPSSVYDEITHSYGNKEQVLFAKKRIMDFSNVDLLHIAFLRDGTRAYSSAKNTDIISICQYIQEQTDMKMFSLITNDNDLIIRARHILNENRTTGESEVCRILSVGYTKYTKEWDKYKSM